MKLRVLLVEDNFLNRELALALLEDHDVSVAVDGAAFRRHLAEGRRPDIVLMDVRLADADGVTLLQELRGGSGREVRAVALTAHAMPSDVDRLIAAGFDGVITKPIDTRTFVATVERYAAGTAD